MNPEGLLMIYLPIFVAVVVVVIVDVILSLFGASKDLTRYSQSLPFCYFVKLKESGHKLGKS